MCFCVCECSHLFIVIPHFHTTKPARAVDAFKLSVLVTLLRSCTLYVALFPTAASTVPRFNVLWFCVASSPTSPPSPTTRVHVRGVRKFRKWREFYIIHDRCWPGCSKTSNHRFDCGGSCLGAWMFALSFALTLALARSPSRFHLFCCVDISFCFI